MDAGTLTDYERRRLENIRLNDEMMASLQIRRKASALTAALKPRPQNPNKKLKPSLADAPVRRSLRHRGLPPDPRHSQQSPADAPNDPQPTPEAAARRKSKRLRIGEAFASGPNSTGRPLIEAILKASERQSLDLGRENGGGGKAFDPRRNLVLRPQNVRKVLDGRTLVIRFLPLTDRTVIVGGDKYGNVGFWDVDGGDGDGGDGVYVYTPHSFPVSGISVHPHLPTKIFTCSYDGFIRLMDVKEGTFNVVYSCDYSIYSICLLPDNASSFYFGERSGELKHWDERKGKTVSTWDLHEQRINTIDFHPQNTNLVATSSTDGLACIWDLRYASKTKMRYASKTKAQSLKTIQHKRAVHSAYFSPTGSYLATTSLDDRVGIVDGVKFDDLSMVWHNNQTGRWISSFRAIWGWDDSNIFIGNVKRAVDVISVPERTTLAIHSEYLTSIPCRFAAHPYKRGFLAGSSSGKFCLWTTS